MATTTSSGGVYPQIASNVGMHGQGMATTTSSGGVYPQMASNVGFHGQGMATTTTSGGVYPQMASNVGFHGQGMAMTTTSGGAYAQNASNVGFAKSPFFHGGMPENQTQQTGHSQGQGTKDQLLSHTPAPAPANALSSQPPAASLLPTPAPAPASALPSHAPASVPTPVQIEPLPLDGDDEENQPSVVGDEDTKEKEKEKLTLRSDLIEPEIPKIVKGVPIPFYKSGFFGGPFGNDWPHMKVAMRVVPGNRNPRWDAEKGEIDYYNVDGIRTKWKWDESGNSMTCVYAALKSLKGRVVKKTVPQTAQSMTGKTQPASMRASFPKVTTPAPSAAPPTDRPEQPEKRQLEGGIQGGNAKKQKIVEDKLPVKSEMKSDEVGLGGDEVLKDETGKKKEKETE